MEVYKPKQELVRQKKKQKRKQTKGPRGAVIRSTQVVQEPLLLKVRKNISDWLSEIERLTGFVNKWVLVSLIALMISSVLWSSMGSLKAEMPIEKVSVKGDFFQLDKGQLEQTLAPLVGTNYFDLKVQAIKNTLLEYAWVQSVEVRKVWPAQVEVLVVENKAIAAWGNDALVNERGEVFKPESINRSVLGAIPDLNGNEQQSELVLQTYAELAEMSSVQALKISEFSMVSNGFWKLRFENGPELSITKGREKESMSVFLKAYALVFKPRGAALARVDLRYNNGFAVEFARQGEDQLAVKTKSNKKQMGKSNG